MDRRIRAFLSWVVQNPLTVLIVIIVLAVLVAPQLVGALLIGTLNKVLEHVLLPLIPLAIVIWAILWILGYGRLWGKKKSK